MNKHIIPVKLAALILLALSPIVAVRGEAVFSFPFNEGGTETVTTDSVQGVQAKFGAVLLDPELDTVALTNDSPSGLPGDGAFFNSGKGFLIADDSATKVLAGITNGPITMEAWVKKNGNFANTTEGVVSYGGTYKMGFRTSGVMVFTLLGRVDITSTMTTRLPFDEWVHIATVWQPGVGVTFYVGSNSLFGATNKFVANTTTPANSPIHNFLSMGNEGVANPLVGTFDRIRIHNAALSQAELDEDRLNPKANYASTVVSYNFNESNFPCTNSLTPSLPATSGAVVAPTLTGPVWTNGVTSDPNDRALYFDGGRRAIFIDDSGSPKITLGPDTSGTNGDYTLQAWVKLPLGFEPTARMIMFTYQANPSFSFSINTGRRLHTTTLGKDDVLSGAQVPNDNQWHHVAAVHQNGTEVRFYVDGVLLSKMPYIRGPGSQTTYQLTLGGASSITANPFIGTLDRISLTKGALEPSEFDLPGYVPPQPLPPGDSTSGLVLHLKLDETNGMTAFDSTGGGHNGSLINFTNVDNSQWLAGRVGGSLRFLTNAAVVTNSTRVNIADPSGAFNFSTNGTARTNSSFSVAAWIYAASPQIQGSGIVAHGFGPEQFALDALSGSNLRFVIRNPAGIAIEVLTIPNNNNLRVTNRWIHLVGVFDGAHPTNGLRLYVDGFLANANDAPVAVFDKAYDVTVGAREFNNTSGYTQAFQGLIDDVRLYNRALSPADVATLYQEADIPRLTLLANGTLSWPITSLNFVPQSASSLAASNTVWTDLPGTPTVNGYNKTLPVSLTATNEFYRLRSAP